MVPLKNSSGKYSSVDPEDYFNYEEQFQEKGSGGGGSKAGGGKGKKTLKNLKRQQRAGSLHQRREELEKSLCLVLARFSVSEGETQENQILIEYATWVENNLFRPAPLDPSEVVLSFSKSGGPGGQNVNKRETRVALFHKPTRIQVVCDQARSQGKNRALAFEQLEERLEKHVLDWKNYLGANQKFEVSLLKALLDRKS